MLIGLGKMVKKVASGISLLANKVLGFTSVTTVPVQKKSLIKINPYAPILISKTENPYTWQEVSKQVNWPLHNGKVYLATSGSTLTQSMDAVNWTNYSMPLNPITQTDDLLGIRTLILDNRDYFVAVMTPGDYSESIYVTSQDGSNWSVVETPGTPVCRVGDSHTLTVESTDAIINGEQTITNVYYLTTDLNSPTAHVELMTIVSVGNLRTYTTNIVKNGNVYAYVKKVINNGVPVSNTICTSTNLTSWTETTLTHIPDQTVQDISVIDGKFVLYSSSYSGSNDQTLSWASDVSSAWQSSSLASLGSSVAGKQIDRFFKFDDKLAVPAIGSNYIISSSDGATWTVEDLGKPIDYSEIFLWETATVTIELASGSSYYTTMTGGIEDGGILFTNFAGHFKFPVSGLGTYSGTSLSGLSSTNPNFQQYDSLISGIYYQNNYIISSQVATYKSSDKGSSWTQTSSERVDKMVIGNVSVLGYRQSNFDSKFLATYDGDSWFSYTPGNLFINDIGFGTLTFNGGLVTTSRYFGRELENAVAYGVTGGFNGYSAGGTTRYRLTTNGGADNLVITSATYNPALNAWYAIGYTNEDTTTSALYTCPRSSDGINWELVGEYRDSSGNTINYQGAKIAYANGAMFMYATSGQYFSNAWQMGAVSSVNGTNWSGIYRPENSWQYPTFVSAVGDKVVIGSVSGFLGVSYEYPYYSLSYKASTNTIPISGTELSGIVAGQISTLVETQISIGGQGDGSAEILAPVVVYRTPSGQNPLISSIELVNSSTHDVLVDIGIVDDQSPLLSGPNIIVADRLVPAGQTVTVSYSTQMYGSQRIVALPSSVDELTVRIYGTI